jgi:hypothetical protein
MVETLSGFLLAHALTLAVLARLPGTGLPLLNP